MDRPLQSAWQPLTPRGVAAFAGASGGRLLLVQAVCAGVLAAAVTWCIQAAWFPTLAQAVQNLPEQGEIRQGQLDWPAAAPQWLAQGRFLAVAVDPEHSGVLRGPADVQVELGRRSVRLVSLLGYVDLEYPPLGQVALTRAEAVPWWGAWSPAILAGCFSVTFAGLLAGWTLLATLYGLPVWLLGFFANRELTLVGSWRLAGAALLPGALLVALAVWLYGAGVLDLLRLLAVAAFHVVVGWIYLCASPLQLPRVGGMVSPRGNPFASAGDPRQAAARPPPDNPFASGKE